MIGSIRKHSKWLWIVIATLTIISFVVFMGSGPVNSGGGSASTGYGSIYGEQVKAQDYARAQGVFFLYHWLRFNQWPDKAGMSREDMNRETYVRVLLMKKAAALGISVDEATVAKAATELLRSIGRNGQAVPMQEFVKQVLAPEGLSALDLQNFLRDELVVQQLIQTLGVSGALVPPQEAGMLYDREYQEVSAQAVFFAASNYLASVAITPAAVGQFYTNNMAAYREPDRVSVNYVFCNVTNHLAQSKADWEKTNFTEVVEAAFRQYGMEQFADAKTPEEAKARIRDLLIRDRALRDARQTANDFATELFNLAPVKPENLAALAKQKGLVVRTTAPFSAQYGPAELNASGAFIRSAFQLNAEEPYAGPVAAADGFYVIALEAQVPSAIPSLEQIRSRVVQDFQMQSAIIAAQRAGTNFYATLAAQMAAGKTFAQAAVAAGHAPVVLAPFSLSSQDIPEIGEHATIGQIKQAVFTTPVGRVSNFMPDNDGGFVVFVQELLPVDAVKKAASLPQFMAQVRRARQGEAFNQWLMGEANRELKDTPVYAQISGEKKNQP
jgi:peptidyl-prolyl cis-trans isomerase D